MLRIKLIQTRIKSTEKGLPGYLHLYYELDNQFMAEMKNLSGFNYHDNFIVGKRVDYMKRRMK